MSKSIRTRREFLGNCALTTLGLALPHFLVHTTEAAVRGTAWDAGSPDPLPGFKDDRILVVVQLGGGNDGLNTIIPYTDDSYLRARPNLAPGANSRISVDDSTAFNIGLRPLLSRFESNEFTVIEGVGYPNPNRSHFRSMEIWQTASDSNRYRREGWIGRYFDNCCEGTPEPSAGIFVGEELPQAFAGASGAGIAFETPKHFGYIPGGEFDSAGRFRAMNPTDAGTRNGSLDFLRAVTDNANISADKIHATTDRVRNAVAYPRTPFAESLATVAQMIAGGLGSRIYYVPLTGFDTHAGQAAAQSRLLEWFASGMSAFQRDLDQMGQADRVLTMAFSEFGRRVEENASAGTDHGTAGPLFLFGPQLKGGWAGRRPDLTQLDVNGDLKFTTDFRSVYATILEDWLGADQGLVLPRPFKKMDLLCV